MTALCRCRHSSALFRPPFPCANTGASGGRRRLVQILLLLKLFFRRSQFVRSSRIAAERFVPDEIVFEDLSEGLKGLDICKGDTRARI